MKINDKSFSIIITGDWSSTFARPDWIAKNVFQADQIELSIENYNKFIKLSCKYQDVIVMVTEDRACFSLETINDDSISSMCLFINNFINKSYSPFIGSYGLNISYFDKDVFNFAKTLDNMDDQIKLSSKGYEIINTKIIRSIKKDGKIFNINLRIENLGNENQKLVFDINNHYNLKDKNVQITFNKDFIKSFFEDCEQLLSTYEFELEGAV